MPLGRMRVRLGTSLPIRPGEGEGRTLRRVRKYWFECNQRREETCGREVEKAKYREQEVDG